ncbi:MAG: aminotransferase class V-fold PLP-dependent enzyme [Pirellulales bacterium]|nr:aminotransferase class V-fold PLP-dependent enzyme [Pirellulales bacterium]
MTAWWEDFRRQMPITERWAYFDHAAVAPLSKPAYEAIGQWSREAVQEGTTIWGNWNRAVERARRAAARLLGADPDEVALVHNTTEGIGFVAEGLDWRDGDNVITLDSEFPSNVFPWKNLATRGVECRLLSCQQERLDLATLEQAIDHRTRLVAVSWVGYLTGWRNDLDALAELAQRRGVLLFVDAIQGLGVTPLDVRETPIDFLAADGHKWLLGPEGAGIFYVRRERLDQLRPLMVGWNSVVQAGDFTRLDYDVKPAASRYEGGSHNMVGLLGLGASLELLLSYGPHAIHERIVAVTDLLCERLAGIGAEVASSREPGRQSGIVSFSLPGQDPQTLRREALEQGVVLNCRGGRVRTSPHAYTNEADLERLIETLVAPR